MTKAKLINLLKQSEIINKTIYCTLDDYKRASKEYIQQINPVKNRISAVYQVGSIGVPGISDIDYFLIFQDDKFDSFRKYGISKLSEKTKYIFSHDGRYINDEIAKDLKYCFPFFDLNKIYGKKIDIKYSKDFNIHLLLAVQYLITKIPVDFITYSIRYGKLYQRIMLAMIYSLRHTVNLFRKFDSNYPKEWDTFISEYSFFRENWFSMRNEDEKNNKLIEYIADGIIISFEIIESLGRYLKELNIVSSIDSFKAKLNNRVLKFDKRWTKEEAYNNFLDNEGLIIHHYPIELGFYIYLWAKSNTGIGNQLYKQIKKLPAYEIPEGIKYSFNFHCNAMEKYNNFSKKKFKVTANSYNTLWANYSLNPIDNFVAKIYRKISSFL